MHETIFLFSEISMSYFHHIKLPSERPHKMYPQKQNSTSECLSTSAMQKVPFKVQFWRLFILQQFKPGPNWLFFWFKWHLAPQGKEHKQLANLQPLSKIALTWGDSLNIACYNFFLVLELSHFIRIQNMRCHTQDLLPAKVNTHTHTPPTASF